MMKSKPSKILIVDDDEKIVFAIQLILEKDGFTILTAQNGKEGLEILRREAPDITILDIQMPEMSGLEMLEKINEHGIDTSVIIVTGFGTMETAIRSMQLEAFDYLTKPLDMEKIRILCRRALEIRGLKKEIHGLRAQLDVKYEEDALIGNSSAMQEIYKTIGIITATPNDSSILIQGESGTGKELVAKAIHRNSHRASYPFVVVNCTVLPENLLESELFGHEKGAYTGAHERKIGRLELGNKGTVFFDEIGDLSLNLQQKLLRVLQEREFERLGGNETLKVEALFIFATNHDLEKEVRLGNFREDLFFRMNVIPIKLPSLRERREDIPLLVNHFVAKYNRKLGKAVTTISKEAMEALEAYDYPGNVRELSNLIERAIALNQKPVLTLECLPETLHLKEDKNAFDIPIKEFNYRKARKGILTAFERKFLSELLKAHHGNVATAAKEAGIERQSFYRLLKKHHINPKHYNSLPSPSR
ncbi:MAG: sigma-54-dependent transcriptional regulator [bacterium]